MASNLSLPRVFALRSKQPAPAWPALLESVHLPSRPILVFSLALVASFSPPTRPAQADPVSGTWLEVDGVGRTEHSLVYDPLRNRFLIFGGRSRSAPHDLRNDVWALELTGTPHWVELKPGGTLPPPRCDHVAVYDPIGDRMIVHGGVVPVPPGPMVEATGDTWALSLSGEPTWTQLSTSGPGLGSSAAVYDAGRGRVVLYGGYSKSASSLNRYPTNQVWTLSLAPSATWTQVSPVNPIGMPPPSARFGHAAVYDPLGDRMVVFGGDYGILTDYFLGDVWSLSLGDPFRWALLTPTGTAPAERAYHAAALDSERGRMVVFGGLGSSAILSDAWALDLQGGTMWTELTTSGPIPSVSDGGAAAYDPAGDGLLYLGGGETAELHVGTSPYWEVISNIASPPPPRRMAAAVLDSGRHRMLVFGGQGTSSPANDTWAMSLDPPFAWQQLHPSGSPPPQQNDALAVYDPEGDRMVIFGGYDPLGQTWALNLSPTPNWVQLSPGGTQPYTRHRGSAVYDPVHRAMVIFGGTDGYSTYFNDTWTLSLADPPTWSLFNPAGTPPTARYGQVAVYDPAGRRMLVFGGVPSGGPIANDVWSLTLDADPAWTELAPSGALPPARVDAAGVFEEQGNRLVIFGGSKDVYPSGASALQDVWALGLGTNLTWTKLSPAGRTPDSRMAHSAIYDSTGCRMVVFGGWDDTEQPCNDAWFLSWKDSTTPTLASLVFAASEGGAVQLRWYSEEPGIPATLYRRTEDTDWRERARLEADTHGFLDFSDREVAPGQRYGYRLRILDGDQEVFVGEVWVAVPELQLALYGTHPNPTIVASASVAFTLSGSAPAALKVFDVGGRMVLNQDVGSLGPGYHEVRLWSAPRLGPGLYVLQLTQGSETLKAKAVLLP